MLINRDNYETFFLLYVDNELSAEERRVVEEFVSANADLHEELEVLYSTVLPDNDAIFVPKTQLYKNATPVESVQESLLLMLDNELGEEFQPGILQQINESPEVGEEWSVLQKTVLDKSDRVVFRNKKSLYRHTSRVIPMRLWRVAAAILIGAGIFSAITLYNSSQPGDAYSVRITPDIKTTPKPVEIKATQPVGDEKELLVTGGKTDEMPGNKVERKEKNPEDGQPLVKERLRKVKEEVLQDEKRSPDREPVLVKQDNTVEKSTVRPVENTDEIAVTASPIKGEINNSLINDLEIGKAKITFARLAVNDEDPDRFLNIEEDKVTRTKLGGLIRQVKRVVERNTKIKTSNGLRIGGFEIAIK